MPPLRGSLPLLALLALGGCALKPIPVLPESPWVEAAPWPDLAEAPLAPTDLGEAVARAAEARAILEPQAQGLAARAVVVGAVDVAPEARGVTPPPQPQGAPIPDPAALAALGARVPASPGAPVDVGALEALARRAPPASPAAPFDSTRLAALARQAPPPAAAPFDVAALDSAGAEARSRAARPAPRISPQIARPPPSAPAPGLSAADAAALAEARARAARPFGAGSARAAGSPAADAAVLAAARARASGAFDLDAGALDSLAAEARRRAAERMRAPDLPAAPASPEAGAEAGDPEAEELLRRVEELRRRQEEMRREASPAEEPPAAAP